MFLLDLSTFQPSQCRALVCFSFPNAVWALTQAVICPPKDAIRAFDFVEGVPPTWKHHFPLFRYVMLYHGLFLSWTKIYNFRFQHRIIWSYNQSCVSRVKCQRAPTLLLHRIERIARETPLLCWFWVFPANPSAYRPRVEKFFGVFWKPCLFVGFGVRTFDRRLSFFSPEFSKFVLLCWRNLETELFFKKNPYEANCKIGLSRTLGPFV